MRERKIPEAWAIWRCFFARCSSLACLLACWHKGEKLPFSRSASVVRRDFNRTRCLHAPGLARRGKIKCASLRTRASNTHERAWNCEFSENFLLVAARNRREFYIIIGITLKIMRWIIINFNEVWLEVSTCRYLWSVNGSYWWCIIRKFNGILVFWERGAAFVIGSL